MLLLVKKIAATATRNQNVILSVIFLFSGDMFVSTVYGQNHARNMKLPLNSINLYPELSRWFWTGNVLFAINHWFPYSNCLSLLFFSSPSPNFKQFTMIPSKKWAECCALRWFPCPSLSVWLLSVRLAPGEKQKKKGATFARARVFSHGKSGSTPNTPISWVTLTLPEVPNVAYENPHHFLVLVHTIKNGGFFHGYVVSLQECNITDLGGGFIFLDVHRYLGKSIRFDYFVQMGWNHHLDSNQSSKQLGIFHNWTWHNQFLEIYGCFQK